MRSLACALVMFVMCGVSQAEEMAYQMDYKSWANDSNYPASRCFSPSFKADEFCGSGAQNIVENCSDADSSLVKYIESRCNEETGKVPIIYHVESGRLVGIGGYFGEFNVNYRQGQYLKDLKSLLSVHDHLIDEQVMAYRVGSPLENRVYLVLGDTSDRDGFKLLEYVRDCKEYVRNKGASSCNIAEYVVGR